MGINIMECLILALNNIFFDVDSSNDISCLIHPAHNCTYTSLPDKKKIILKIVTKSRTMTLLSNLKIRQLTRLTSTYRESTACRG